MDRWDHCMVAIELRVVHGSLRWKQSDEEMWVDSSQGVACTKAATDLCKVRVGVSITLGSTMIILIGFIIMAAIVYTIVVVAIQHPTRGTGYITKAGKYHKPDGQFKLPKR